MSQYCSNCGGDLKNANKFCPECGHEPMVPEEKEVETIDTVKENENESFSEEELVELALQDGSGDGYFYRCYKKKRPTFNASAFFFCSAYYFYRGLWQIVLLQAFLAVFYVYYFTPMNEDVSSLALWIYVALPISFIVNKYYFHTIRMKIQTSGILNMPRDEQLKKIERFRQPFFPGIILGPVIFVFSVYFFICLFIGANPFDFELLREYFQEI